MGNTPLHLACQANEVDTVEVLIEKGADLNCLNQVSANGGLRMQLIIVTSSVISFCKVSRKIVLETSSVLRVFTNLHDSSKAEVCILQLRTIN